MFNQILALTNLKKQYFKNIFNQYKKAIYKIQLLKNKISVQLLKT